MKKILPVLSLILFIANSSDASLKNDLENAFNDLRNSTTTTAAQAYKGQRAGFYTGGSLSNRSQVREYHLANVRFPKVSAGCSGIDIFTGGMSFINSKELKDALKNIANNSLTYSFMLGLETISPVIKNQIESLSNKADAINRMNINSCEMSAALVGSVWPKTDAASEKICETLAMSNNAVSDRVKARHQCANPSARKEIVANGQKSSGTKDLIFDNTNLAWLLLGKQLNLSSDKSLAEFLMSLSGTIIIQYQQDEIVPRTMPSLMSNDHLISGLLEGGEVTVYQCDDIQKCLNPTIRTRNITQSESFGYKVANLLESIQAKIKVDSALSDEEIRLLGNTELPIYKILNVQSAFEGGDSLIGLSHYSNIIALDLVYHYLKENLESLTSQSGSLPNYPAHLLSEYQLMLSRVLMQVRYQEQLMMQKLDVNTHLIERTMELEKSLSGRLSTDLASQMRASQKSYLQE